MRSFNTAFLKGGETSTANKENVLCVEPGTEK